jgi:hypothetical protein
MAASHAGAAESLHLELARQQFECKREPERATVSGSGKPALSVRNRAASRRTALRQRGPSCRHLRRFPRFPNSDLPSGRSGEQIRSRSGNRVSVPALPRRQRQFAGELFPLPSISTACCRRPGALSARWMQPAQQHSRFFPTRSSSRVLAIRRWRVAACFASTTQQINHSGRKGSGPPTAPALSSPIARRLEGLPGLVHRARHKSISNKSSARVCPHQTG